MQYLMLVYYSEQAWLTRSPDEQAEIYGSCVSHNQELAEQGVFLDGSPLALTSTAQTVRVRDGETFVTDGPFAETKEQLGGYFLVECRDRAHAHEVSAGILDAQQNTFGGLEIRTAGEED